MTEKKQLLVEWMQRVWTEQEVAAIDELFVVAGRARGLGERTLVGPEGFKKFHRSLSSLLQKFIITIDHSIEEGDWLSALITIDANSKQTHESVRFTGSVHVEISNGQIQQAYNHIDFMGLFAQLGLLPDDCFEQGLSGYRVG